MSKVTVTYREIGVQRGHPPSRLHSLQDRKSGKGLVLHNCTYSHRWKKKYESTQTPALSANKPLKLPSGAFSEVLA